MGQRMPTFLLAIAAVVALLGADGCNPLGLFGEQQQTPVQQQVPLQQQLPEQQRSAQPLPMPMPVPAQGGVPVPLPPGAMQVPLPEAPPDPRGGWIITESPVSKYPVTFGGRATDGTLYFNWKTERDAGYWGKYTATPPNVKFEIHHGVGASRQTSYFNGVLSDKNHMSGTFEQWLDSPRQRIGGGSWTAERE